MDCTIVFGNETDTRVLSRLVCRAPAPSTDPGPLHLPSCSSTYQSSSISFCVCFAGNTAESYPTPLIYYSNKVEYPEYTAVFGWLTESWCFEASTFWGLDLLVVFAFLSVYETRRQANSSAGEPRECQYLITVTNLHP